LEAVPPGQLATKINPKEKKGGKSNKVAKTQPKKGIIVNCKKNPINNQDGYFTICLKWFKSNVKPIPNIIIPRPIVIKFPENQVKISGLNKASKEAIKTNQGK
jgi:hypothetical protein